MEASPALTDLIRSPYDNAVVGEMPVAGEAEIEAAIVAAQRGFQIMRRMPRFMRADILQRASELLRSRRDQFVRMISAEAGKPLFDARGEVSRAIFNLPKSRSMVTLASSSIRRRATVARV
jgi:acyl-CoA reductase-like NAD-dependent aldehyde dehydrogenase